MPLLRNLKGGRLLCVPRALRDATAGGQAELDVFCPLCAGVQDLFGKLFANLPRVADAMTWVLFVLYVEAFGTAEDNGES